jgi:hypothetical protein
MAPSTQKTWRDSLPIDMLLFAVSLLIAAQLSSEVPEGLMNYSVYNILYYNIFIPCGPGSSVGIATGRSGDRIPVGARFSAPVQTGPGAHPASCKMGTESLPGVESGRGVTLTPHSLLVPRSKNRVELYLYFP